MFNAKDINTIRTFVAKLYQQINDDEVFITAVDSYAIGLLKLLKIDVDIIENIKANNNTDYFTFYPITNNNDIDLMLFLYIGKRNDSGMVSLYMKQIFKNQTILTNYLSSILEHQKTFNEKSILNSLINTIKKIGRESFPNHEITYSQNFFVLSKGT